MLADRNIKATLVTFGNCCKHNTSNVADLLRHGGAGVVIKHNIPALNASRKAKDNTTNTSKSLEKLSSGFKVNRAADDAAGLGMSEKMRGQIRGVMMGTQNVKMGINLIQTAEGGLNEVHSIMQRMRELAVQSSNGTYTDEDREGLDKEYQALMDEIGRIAETTHYNNIPLLNVPPGYTTGSAAEEEIKKARDLIDDSYRIVVGTGGTNDRIEDLYDEFAALSAPYVLADLQDIASKLASTVEIANGAFESVINAVNSLINELGDSAFDADLLQRYRDERYFHYDDKDHYIDIYLDPARTGTAGALATLDPNTARAQLNIAFNAAWGSGGGIVACHEPVADAAWALLEDVTVTKEAIAGGSGENALWIQSGANRGEGLYVNRCDVRPSKIGIDPSSVNPFEKANAAIDLIDTATHLVSSYRADFGASQNRLESIEKSNGVKAENLQAAESIIRDLDMAKEMVEYTKNNILVQTAQSMIAQANQLPQGVLSLLR